MFYFLYFNERKASVYVCMLFWCKQWLYDIHWQNASPHTTIPPTYYIEIECSTTSAKRIISCLHSSIRHTVCCTHIVLRVVVDVFFYCRCMHYRLMVICSISCFEIFNFVSDMNIWRKKNNFQNVSWRNRMYVWGVWGFKWHRSAYVY